MKPEKISPQLLAMMDDQQKLARSDFAARYSQRGAVADNTSKPERVIVFVQCDADADLAYLAAEGIRVNQTTGTIRTAFLPVEKLGLLSDEPTVHRIESTEQLRFSMDLAGDKTHLPQFRQSMGLTGAGVVIGIVDSGIDPKHPAFAGRVLRVWDQVIFGPGVPEGGYGVELTGPMKDVSRDGRGHGTHVAGIAAGKDSAYGGVAPEAKLVIVKSDLNNGHVADALKYIMRVAYELDCPAVVNFSFGGHHGPHDGTDYLSHVIDEASGPGRIVCVAAGNEGNDAIHARMTLTQGQLQETRIQVSKDAELLLLNGWVSDRDTIEVALRSPEGQMTKFHGLETIKLDEELVDLGPPKITDQVQTILAGEVWSNQHRYFNVGVALSPRTGDTTWTLLLRGATIVDGQIDVWVQAARPGEPFDSFAQFLDDVHDGIKISEPATAAMAITVASYTTRKDWRDNHGHQRSIPFTLNDISPFSSPGPLRNGAEKPDVAAPGAMIISALSADSGWLNDPTNHTAIDPLHLALPGTSMAAPFITGLVALLLEHDPQLDPTGVKQILKSISSIPGQLGGTFDPKWGYGLIDTDKLSTLLQPTPLPLIETLVAQPEIA